jgi:hypothetical protein
VHQVVGGGSWDSTPLSMTNAVGLPFENHLALCWRKGSPYQPWALKELCDIRLVYPTFTWMSRYVHFQKDVKRGRRRGIVPLEPASRGQPLRAPSARGPAGGRPPGGTTPEAR